MGMFFPPAAAAGGATDLTGTWINPTVPYSLGSLVAVNDASINHFGGSGLWANAVANFNVISYQAPSDSEGGFTRIQPGAVNLQDGFMEGLEGLNPGPGYDFLCKFRTDSGVATNNRLWLGVFVGAGGTLAGTQDPAGEHAAMRFSEADTNFTFLSKGASQQTTVTSVAPTGSTIYYLRISVRPSSVTFQLYDSTFASLSGPTEHTTFFPSNNARMRPILYTQNDGLSVEHVLDLFFCHVAQRET